MEDRNWVYWCSEEVDNLLPMQRKLLKDTLIAQVHKIHLDYYCGPPFEDNSQLWLEGT